MLSARNSPLLLLPACLLLTVPAAAAPPDDWKFDVVHLANGNVLRGLVVEETKTEIIFRSVVRKPGVRTVVFPMTLQREEIDHIDRLDAKDRDILAARLKALDPTGKNEAIRMASLELEQVPWRKDGKGKALRYESTLFTLDASAPEDTARRAAVRLEQVYTAYNRFLPPRVKDAEPTKILLTTSLMEYQALLKEQGQVMLNAAFYDTKKNQVLCGADLQKLPDELEQNRHKTEKLLQELKDKEAELNRVYKNKVPAALLKPIQDARAEADRFLKQNDEAFEKATRQLFRVLQHESFHAYLGVWVYPPDQAEVPRWLNEGLAQVFETAFVEAGELRIGHAEKARLTQAQAALAKNDLVPLGDLLVSGPKQFVVTHGSEKATSDRHYLTFDRRLMGTKAMDAYVKSLKRGTEPATAFRDLVGQPLPEFEKQFKEYLKGLKPDGTARKP